LGIAPRLDLTNRDQPRGDQISRRSGIGTHRRNALHPLDNLTDLHGFERTIATTATQQR
jgi:hypothetical protein